MRLRCLRASRAGAEVGKMKAGKGVQRWRCGRIQEGVDVGGLGDVGGGEGGCAVKEGGGFVVGG